MAKKKVTKVPVPVRFSPDELIRLDELKQQLGVESRNHVIRWLVNNAHVRPSTAIIMQPDPVQQN